MNDEGHMGQKFSKAIALILLVALSLASCGRPAEPSVSTAQSDRAEEVDNATRIPTATPEPTVETPATSAAANVETEAFLMRIEDVFSIEGRGTIATGRVSHGVIATGDEVEIIDDQDQVVKTVVTGVEMLGNTLEQAEAGQNVGILLRGIDAEDLATGMISMQPGSFTTYRQAEQGLTPTNIPSDSPIPDTGTFLMAIEEVFSIEGRGTIVTGRIAQGALATGDEVEIIDERDQVIKTVVTGIEMFREVIDEAEAGENVGILLRGIAADDLAAGMILMQPGSFTSYAEAQRKFE